MFNPFTSLKRKRDQWANDIYEQALEKRNLKRQTTLEKNFIKLRSIMENSPHRKVAIIGQPGAGKSSLLIKLTDGKCEPLPCIGAQTDATDWSINESIDFIHFYKDIDFIDSPGYGTEAHPVKSYQNLFPFDQCHVILFFIQGKIHQSDERMFHTLLTLSKQSCQIAIIRNFSEYLSQQDQLDIQKDLDSKLLYTRFHIPIYFVSNRSKMGIEEVKHFIHAFEA